MTTSSYSEWLAIKSEHVWHMFDFSAETAQTLERETMSCSRNAGFSRANSGFFTSCVPRLAKDQ